VVVAQTGFTYDSNGTGYLSGKFGINFSGATDVFEVHGTGGKLFSITDDLSSSLMSVNSIAGLPIFEVFANNTIIGGQYASGDFVITGNKIGFGILNPSNKVHISGSTDPLRIQNIAVGTDTNYLTIDANGVVHYKTTGASGSSGTSGSSGSSGTSGSSGSSGTSGSSGLSGIGGSSASSGTSGYISKFSASTAVANSIIYESVGSTSTNIGIGTTGPSVLYALDVNGQVHATSFPTSSDVRFKKKIKPITDSLSKIKQIKGVSYEWNEYVNSIRNGYALNTPILGFLAQDLEKILPEVVQQWKLSDDCQDARSVDYIRVIPVLVEAIKEQQHIIESQQSQINIISGALKTLINNKTI